MCGVQLAVLWVPLVSHEFMCKWVKLPKKGHLLRGLGSVCVFWEGGDLVMEHYPVLLVFFHLLLTSDDLLSRSFKRKWLKLHHHFRGEKKKKMGPCTSQWVCMRPQANVTAQVTSTWLGHRDGARWKALQNNRITLQSINPVLTFSTRARLIGWSNQTWFWGY